MIADEIRETVSILDVLEALDLPRPDRSGKVTSWLRAETEPSVHIYEDDNRWWDYGAGQGGDVISLVQSFFGCSFGKAAQFLSGRIDESMIGKGVKPAGRTVIDLWERWLNESKPLDVEAFLFVERQWGTWALYALTHGLFDVRQANRALWIAHWGDQNASVVGIKVRSYTGQRFSVQGSTFTSGLYGGGDMSPEERRAVLVEGEPDVWTLTGYLDNYGGYRPTTVYGLPAGAGLWRDEWIPTLARHTHTIVCLDNDDAGRKATAKILPALAGAGVKAVDVGQDLPAKDVTDAINQGFDPIQAWVL